MSKKLLKESTIRRFGGLAGIRPATTSNFLTEFGDPVYVREEEEEVVDDFELELPPEGVEDIGDVEFEDEEEIVVEPELGGDAEGLVMSLLDKVKEWAGENGVDMELDGEAAGEEDLGDLDVDLDADLDLDLDAEEEEVDLDMGEEPGLEEMIGSILAEEDEEDLTEEKEEVIEEEEEVEEGTKAGRARKGQPPGARLGYDDTKKESIQVVSDEKVIQEVTRRVKQRLARIAKSRKK